MYKNLFFIVLSVFVSFGTQAQNAQKAENLLNQVYEKVKSYDNMVIKFDYILRDDANRVKQKTNGSVALKGEKYRLELMGVTRIFDGEKLYSIIPEDEEINIAPYNPNKDGSLSPSEMLSFYRNGYSYQWDITQNVHGRKVQYIKLIPNDKQSEIKNILLGIDPITKHISKLIQLFKDGSEVVIDVKSFRTNQPLSENMFTFNENKYPGYYINRLY